MKQTLAWYDKLAELYDLLTFKDRPYRQARELIIQMLDLQEGDVVVDLFCGTGVNFAPILRQIGPTGRIIGIDGSAGMLAKARRRIQRNGWNPDQIELIEKDLGSLRADFLAGILPEGCIPKVLITLALTVFPNYEEVVDCIFAAMPKGARFALMEVYAPENARGAKLLDFIGAADCSRRVWEPFKARAAQYQEVWYPFQFPYIQAALVLATGMKEVNDRAFGGRAS